MRIPSPPSLRLDRTELLALVRQRLADSGLPVQPGDLTDPAWLLLEEAAWMVETLSGQLDRYPAALMQQALAVMGASLEPARPAVGLMTVTPSEPGVLDDVDGQQQTVFLTAQTERADSVLFVPAQRRVPLHPLTVSGWFRLSDGQLLDGTAPPPEDDSDVTHAVCPPVEHFEVASTFDRVVICYTLRSSNSEADLARLQAAGDLITRERNGYLGFSAVQTDSGVVLEVEIDPCAGIRRDPEAPECVRVAWRPIYGTSWQPMVRISGAVAMPNRIPEPNREGQIVLRGVSEKVELSGLLMLERPAVPNPRVIDAIWNVVTDIVPSLRGQRLDVQVRLDSVKGAAEADGPSWVKRLLKSRAYELLAGHTRSDMVWVSLPKPITKPGVIRLATSVDSTAPYQVEADRLEIRALTGSEAILLDPLRDCVPRWRVVLPAPQSTRLDRIVGWDVHLPAGTEGLLVRWKTEASEHDADGPEVRLEALTLNPVLVFNAPVVVDGRELFASSVGPVPVDLDATDVVDRSVLAIAGAENMQGWWLPGLGLHPPSTHPASGAVAQNIVGLARMQRVSSVDTLPSGELFTDWQGVSVDPTVGRVVFRVPGFEQGGTPLELDGQRGVSIDWYRRTDGAGGAVAAGQVHFVEQRVGAKPAIAAASNPYPMIGGRAAESPEACIERVYGANREQPMLPLEFEQDLLRCLGRRGLGWWARVWSYSERYMFELRMWQQLPLKQPSRTPLDDPTGEYAVRARPSEVEDADETVLVVALGPMQGREPTEMAWARKSAQTWFRRLRQRYPMLQSMELVPFRALTLFTPVPISTERPLPDHGFFALPEETLRSGWVEDSSGERRRLVRDLVLVDAAIVRIELIRRGGGA